MSATVSNADLPTQVVQTCHARIGLMGNPSDGYFGKTLSVLIDNFAATVWINLPTDGKQVEFVPNPAHDPFSFESVEAYTTSAVVHVSGDWWSIKEFT